MPRARRAPAGKPVAAPVRSLVTCLAEGELEQCLVDIGASGKHGHLEELKVMSRKQLLDLCAAMLELCTAAVHTIRVEPEHDEAAADEEEQLKRMSRAMELVQGVATLGHDILDVTKEQVPDTLLQTASLLHDSCLLSLDYGMEMWALQEPIVRLCCHWFALKAPNCEVLVPQAFPLLLHRAVDQHKPTDIKACYTLRDAFSLFDYTDDSIEFTRQLMLQAAIAPAFLHRQEGRKFISFLFRLHQPLVTELTCALKQQVASGRRSVLDAYGDILFRAWRDSVGGPFQFDIEADCIQVLMKAAIGASTPALGASVRHVLASFHSQKKMAGVDAMLARLYAPILFRAFGAANVDVRRNALLLLLDAFPIRDPDAPPEETDEGMTCQFRLLQGCLQDPCPLVREVSARGVIRLLNAYWELIPLAAIAVFVTKLTNEVAFDMSWPGVRVAVLETLPELVDNPHAQPVLKQALPKLAPLLADPVLKVREAMARLLECVSRSRSLHFWEVVPLEELLAVIAVDAPSVAGLLTSLLLPSYFPDAEEGPLLVANLVKSRPQAGLAFCRYLVSSYVAAAGAGEEEGELAAPPPGASIAVPLEDALVLVARLMHHMLATCTHLVTSSSPAGGAAKKQRSSRAKQGKAATGKRRKAAGKQAQQPEAGSQADAEEEGAAAGDGAAGEEAVEVVEIVESEPETVDTWVSWAAALGVLSHGLACAVKAELCGPGNVEVVFEADMLTLMYEAAPNDAARVHIMHVASELPFLKASAALRTLLIKQLASSRAHESLSLTAGAAATAGPSGRAAVAKAGRAAQPAGWLDAALRCVCVAACGPKLMAMLLKAFGLRPAATIHVPVGNAAKPAEGHRHTDGEEEDGRCGACGQAEPEDQLLLCDGCEAMYHMGCVRPMLAQVPQGDWFCHACEQELHSSAITPLGAIRCLEAVLSLPEGRRLLHSHGNFPALLVGLQGQVQGHMKRLTRMLAHCPTATTATAPAAPAAAADLEEGGARKGSKGKGNKGKGRQRGGAGVADDGNVAAEGVREAEGAGHMPQAAPTLSSEDQARLAEAEATVCVFSRAALHLMLLGLSPWLDEEEAEGEEEEGSEEAEVARQEARAHAAQLGVGALLEAVELCEQVMEACAAATAAGGAPPALLHAPLRVVEQVLGVLVDAQSLQMLEVTLGGQLQQVQQVCSLGQLTTTVVSRMLALCPGVVVKQEDEAEEVVPAGSLTAGAASTYLPTIKAALAHLLLLCCQLVGSLSKLPLAAPQPSLTQHTQHMEGTADDMTHQAMADEAAQQAADGTDAAGGAGHAEGGAPQDLEQRMEQEASSEDCVSPEALAAVDSLAGTLLQLLHSPMAGAAGLLSGSIRQHTSTLMAALMEPSCKVPHRWLAGLLSAAGGTLQDGNADGAAAAVDEGGHALADASNAGGAAAPGGNRRVGRSGARKAPVARKRKGKSAASPTPEADEAVEGNGAENREPTTDREPTPVDGEGAAGVAGVHVGEGAEGAQEGAAAGKEAAGMAGPAGLQQLGVLPGLLLNVSKAKGQQVRLLDVAARLACDSWQGASSSLCLGALAVMQQLGVQGLRARRLRLTGHDANLLIKLELLAQDVTTALATAQQVAATAGAGERGEGTGEGGAVALEDMDVGAMHAAQQQVEQAGRVMALLDTLLG